MNKHLTLLCLFLVQFFIGGSQQNNISDEVFFESKFEELTDFLEKSGSSSLILLQDGHYIYQWGDISKKTTVHSIRKTFLNALYGIAITDGIIDSAMSMQELGIGKLFSLEKDEPEAKISDLLKSRSGIYLDAAGVASKIRDDRPERHSYSPGEHFYYNNWDFNTLANIIEEKYSKSIYTLFYEQIAIPLNFDDYKGTYETIDGESEDSVIPDTDGFYQYEKSRSIFPIPHFRMTARDLAKFGQLYLQKGDWNGNQILSEEWVNVSTKPYSIYDEKHGIAYGMLWNVLMETDERKNKAFFHTGVSVHLLGIYPAHDLVFVHRVDTETEYKFAGKEFAKMLDLVFSALEIN